MKLAKTWVTGALLGFGMLLTACDGGNSAAPVSENDLVAKWYFKSSVTKGFFRIVGPDGKDIIKTDIDTSTTYTGTTYFVEFKADKTYNANFPDFGGDIAIKRSAAPAAAAADAESGTWSVSGNVVTTISTEGDTTKVSTAIDGANATFSISMNEKMITPGEGGFESDIDASLKATK